MSSIPDVKSSSSTDHDRPITPLPTWGKAVVITFLVLTTISFIVGIMTVREVGVLKQIAAGWGGGMISAPFVFFAIMCAVAWCRKQPEPKPT